MADIFGVRVTPALEPIDTVIVICNEEGGQTEPSVVYEGNNYIVTWAGYDIRVSCVTPEGVVLDTGYIAGPGNQHPDCASDGNRSLIVWSRNYYGVCGRFVNSHGVPEDTVFRIAELASTSTIPTVAFGDLGYLVVWADFCSTGTHQDIHGQLVGTDGHLLGARLAVGIGEADQCNPHVAFDGSDFLVVWTEHEYDIYGRVVTPDGHLPNPAFRMSDSTSCYREYPSVASNGNRYLVVWSEWRADYDIYGNVEHGIGVEEQHDRHSTQLFKSTCMTTKGLSRYDISEMYDISGRRILPAMVQPGVYFVKESDCVYTKIIIVE
jgi:hypothetical protein